MTKKEREKFILANDKDVRNFLTAFRVILIVFFILIVGILVSATFGRAVQSNINYTFYNDNMFNSTQLGYDFPSGNEHNYNIRNQTRITRDYNATYSFENEIGSYEPNGWTDLSDGTSYCQVLSNINGHDSVLMLNDTQNTSRAKIITYVDDLTYGIIEFWILISDNTKTYYNLIAYNGGTVAINTLIVSGNFKGYWSSSFHDTGISVSNNIWYHSKIIFDCTSDTYDWYINGILGLDDASFQNAVSDIDNYGYSTDMSATTYEYYIDAIGLYFEGEPYIYDYETEMIYDSGSDDSQDSNTQTLGNGHMVLTPDNLGGGFYSCEGFIISGSYPPETSFSGLIDINISSSRSLDVYRLRGYDGATYRTIISGSGTTMYGTDLTVNNEKLLLEFQYTGSSFSIYFDWFINKNSNPDYIICNYTLGSNLIPLSEISQTAYEVDKFEFQYDKDTYKRYVDGYDDPDNWNDYGDSEPVVDDVNVILDTIYSGSKSYGYKAVHIENDGGLYRSFTGLDNYRYNVSFNIKILQNDDSDVGTNRIEFQIKDGSNYLALLYIRYNNDLDIYYSGTYLTDSLNHEGNYTVSFFLDLASQTQYISIYDYDDGTLYGSWFLPFYQTGTEIDYIRYSHTATTSEVESYLLSIGLYDNDGSLSDVIGELRFEYPNGIDDWNRLEYNLVSINFNGYCTLFADYLELQYYNLFDWTNITNTKTINTYDVYSQRDNVFLWIMYDFTFESFSIDGVKLNDGTYNYLLEMDNSSSILYNESYFYSANNKLYFRLTTNDTSLEWIRATFDIVNQETTNYSLYWGGIKNYAQLYSEMRLNFDDSSYNYYQLRTTYQAVISVLKPEMVINTISFIATDNNNNINNTLIGYYNSFELQFYLNQNIAITTSSLLAIIIPLSIISAPTVAVWGSTKKKFGSFLVIPMILGMSIVCYSMSLIPIWLLFVMIVCCGFLYFSKWENYLLIFTTAFSMISAFGVYAGLFPLWIFYISFLSMVLVGVFVYKQTRGGI